MFYTQIKKRATSLISKNIYATFLVLFLIVVGFVGFLQTPTVKAGTTDVFGWLWSSNTGWVSMNCINTNTCAGGFDPHPYGVTQATSGDWSGNGWSSSLGWLKFGTGCPVGASGQCNSILTTSGLSGWALFTQADGNGWDGWVSLSAANDNNLTTPGLQPSAYTGVSPYNYGPTQDATTGAVTGFAWGATNVGWLDFYNVTAPVTTANGNLSLVPSTVSLVNPIGSPNAITISPAQAASKMYLYYYKGVNTTYTSCTASVAPSTPVVSVMWTGAMTPLPLLNPSFTTKSGISVPSQIAGQTNTYTLDCTTAAGTHDIATATVTISTTPVPTLSMTPSSFTAYPPYYKVDLTWSSSNPDFTGTCTGSGGSTGANTYDWNSYPTVGKIAPTTLLPSQTQTQVYVPTNPTTFTITCTKAGGGTLAASTTPVSRNLTVNLSGGTTFCPAGTTYAGSANLTWFAFSDPGTAWCTTPQKIAESYEPAPSPDLDDFTLTYNQPASSVTGITATIPGYYAMVCKDAYGATTISNTELVSEIDTDTPDGACACTPTGAGCSVSPEICNNGLDDNGNLLIDEGCVLNPIHVIEK